MTEKFFIGNFSSNGNWSFVCPNCSDLKKSTKYHMVKFELGEIEKKCSNCGAILYINPLESA